MAQRYSLPFHLTNAHHQPRKRRKRSTHPAVQPPQKPPKTKECYHCHQFKPLSSFHKCRRKKSGLSHLCKQCTKKQRIRFIKRWAKERQRRPPKITKKRCIRCHTVLPLSEFTVARDYKQGTDNLCRSCYKKDVEKYRKKWLIERQETGTPRKKKCTVCHRTLPAESFYDTISIKDGLYNICKDCKLTQQHDLQQRWKDQRTNQPTPAQKTCHQCHRTLPTTAFYPSDHTKDGIENLCRDCGTHRRHDLIRRWSEHRTTHPLNIKEKTCPRCQQRLTITSFSQDEAKKDGYSEYCKTCSHELSNTYKDRWERQRRRHPPKEKTAQCEECQRILPLTKFHRNRNYKSGHLPVCITCTNQKAEQYIQKWQAERKEQPSEKQCRRCQRMLPLNNFRRNRGRKDGFDHLCNTCYKETMSAYVARWDTERKQKESDLSLFESFDKICTACSRTLPISMFYTKKYSKNGYTSTCKDCVRKKSNDYSHRMKNQPKTIPEEKKCFFCKQLLPAAAFNRSSHTPDGLYIYCRTCSTKKQREYYRRPGVHEHRLKESREYQKQRYHAQKQHKTAHGA
jgi:hypothetical protein